MKPLRDFFTGTYVLLLIFVSHQSVDAQQALARQAYAIFEQSCLNCHGPHGAFTEQIVIDSARGLIDSGAVVPGKPIASELYKRLLFKRSGGTDAVGTACPFCQGDPDDR